MFIRVSIKKITRAETARVIYLIEIDSTIQQ